jgi:hypothetical protein
MALSEYLEEVIIDLTELLTSLTCDTHILRVITLCAVSIVIVFSIGLPLTVFFIISLSLP